MACSKDFERLDERFRIDSEIWLTLLNQLEARILNPSD